jgi:hypothetical protein
MREGNEAKALLVAAAPALLDEVEALRAGKLPEDWLAMHAADKRMNDGLRLNLTSMAKFTDELKADLAAERIENAHIREAFRTMEKSANQQETDLERERLRLAACGVAAMQNTPASVAERIGPGHPYYSASYGDVCRAVDREMALRADLSAARAVLDSCGTFTTDPEMPDVVFVNLRVDRAAWTAWKERT